MRTSLAALAAVGLVVLGGACGVRGLNFVEDRRLEMVAPDDEARVHLPIEVRWTMAGDFDGSFGVLVDRAPPPPGRTLEWLVREDRVCQRTPGCPDDAFLAARDIHRTTDTSLVITQLGRTTREGEPDLHDVTVILLDASGQRIGETAVLVTFEVLR